MSKSQVYQGVFSNNFFTAIITDFWMPANNISANLTTSHVTHMLSSITRTQMITIIGDKDHIITFWNVVS